MEDAVDESAMADFPYLIELLEHAATGVFTLADEFEFGLDLILDGLEALHRAETAPGG